MSVFVLTLQMKRSSIHLRGGLMKFAEKNSYSDVKINDIHWHISRQYPIEETRAHLNHEMDYLNLDKIAVMAIEQSSQGEVDNTANIKALYLRDRGEGRIYAFASLRYFGDERDSSDELLNQVKLYHKLGFDGIKMLEGKPSFHEYYNCKIDGERYAKMFLYMEENDIPLLIHVADFIPFPDEAQYKEREIIHTEMLNVIDRHPKLRIVLAHSFNMSYDREGLDAIMEKYPNVSIDLTLGGDILLNMSKDIEEWRKFFVKYSGRILYGTDSYNMYFDEDEDYEVTGRHTPLREFFERTEPFSVKYYDAFPELYGGKFKINPIKLPENIVKDVYYNSFENFAGKTPKSTNKDIIIDYIDELIDGYNEGVLRTCALTPLPDWISPYEKANMARGNELALENLETIKNYYLNEVLL